MPILDLRNAFGEDYEIRYTIDDAGRAFIITVFPGTIRDVSIPATIDGFPVYKVGAFAFQNFENLESASIGGAEEISDYAFAFCRNLKAIDVSSAKYIGRGTFYHCTALENVVLCPAALWHKSAFATSALEDNYCFDFDRSEER